MQKMLRGVLGGLMALGGVMLAAAPAAQAADTPAAQAADTPAAQAADTTHARAAEKPDTIKVGILRLASSGGMFLAVDRGYFAPENIDVQLVFFDAAQPIAVAAASGDIDFGVTAFTTGLFNLAGRGALSVVAGQSRETKGFPLIAYLAATHAPASAAIQTPRDLAGHSVAVTQLGSTFHYSLGLLARKYQFPLASVRIMPMQSLTNVAAAVKGGTVDGALLPVTTARPLIDAGDARLLGWVGDETPWQLGAVFVSHATDAKPALIARFLTAYRHGMHDYAALLGQEKDGVVPVNDTTRPALTTIAKYAQATIDQIRFGLPYADPDGKLDVADVANRIKWNQEMGFVAKGFDVDKVIDRRFVQ